MIAGAQNGKQQAHHTATQSHDISKHSVAGTLPMYTSNTVNQQPMDTLELLNALLSSSCSTARSTHTVDVSRGNHIINSNGSLYAVNMAHVPTSAHKPPMIQLDHLLMEVPTKIWQVLMSVCSNIVSNLQILWE